MVEQEKFDVAAVEQSACTLARSTRVKETLQTAEDGLGVIPADDFLAGRRGVHSQRSIASARQRRGSASRALVS